LGGIDEEYYMRMCLEVSTFELIFIFILCSLLSPFSTQRPWSHTRLNILSEISPQKDTTSSLYCENQRRWKHWDDV